MLVCLCTLAGPPLARNVPPASPRRHIKLQPQLQIPRRPRKHRHLRATTLLDPSHPLKPPLPSLWRTARRGTDTRALHTSLEPTPAVKLEEVSHQLLPVMVRPQHLDMEHLPRLRMGHLRQHTEHRRRPMEHQHPSTDSPQPRTQMRSASSSGR
jgi:hypothetical protein